MANQTDERKILEGDIQLLVDTAKSLGEALAKKLKTSQLRNVYGLVRQAQMEWQKSPQLAYNSIILLQPKLAYFTNRTKGDMRPLQQSLDRAILVLREDKEPNAAHFKNFVDFCEAIVAYHRASRFDAD
jgi:CRISPR type III-A-associated protein Csm2